MGKVILNVNNVSFSYEALEALDSVCFTVLKNDFVGIIGPNGSGKTTLLKCISKVLMPTKGEIHFNEKAIEDYSRMEFARNMAVVSQNTEIAFEFTCEEIVLMGRSPYIPRFGSEKEKDYDIVEQAMKVTNTHHLAKRSIANISGGERQRVFIAQALAQQPKLLLWMAHFPFGYQVPGEILSL